MQEQPSLAAVLDGQVENLPLDPAAMQEDEESQEGEMQRLANYSKRRPDQNGENEFCVECEDQPASLFCQQCADDYCDVCFQALHRKGKRHHHTARKLARNLPPENAENEQAEIAESAEEEMPLIVAQDFIMEQQENAVETSDASFRERAPYIPIRLTLSERKALRLLEAALTVSEYTDKIDIVSYRGGKPQRMVQQIKDLCGILCGLVVATDYQVGQELIRDKDYKFNEKYFRKIFEIGRRHKIMNPEKMRSTYGKLVFLLMDAVSPQVQEMLEFSPVCEIKTVHSWLSEHNADKLLDDPLVEMATREIIPDNKSRYDIQKEIKMKERAIETLAKKYSTSSLSSEDVKQCLYSIGDNNSFLRGNRDPIDKMIGLLKEYFVPNSPEPPFALSISSGNSGARLSHSHERQYYYVLQSLTLWREINHHMFKLWCMAEQDLLDEDNMYRLRDTGQGLNRVQNCPRISREIHRILMDVMRKVGQGNWVGSSVVHLGDTNVPNALMFIDKYTQIARILNPIVLCSKFSSVLSNHFLTLLQLKRLTVIWLGIHRFAITLNVLSSQQTTSRK